jgi:hypothetical protein
MSMGKMAIIGGCLDNWLPSIRFFSQVVFITISTKRYEKHIHIAGRCRQCISKADSRNTGVSNSLSSVSLGKKSFKEQHLVSSTNGIQSMAISGT